jgi:hypothetical protein
MAAPVNFYLSPHPCSTFVDSSKKTDKGAGLSGREVISLKKRGFFAMFLNVTSS